MKQNKIEFIVKSLRKKYGLSFFERGTDPFYVLVSTVLSQRANDKMTYKIAPLLFEKYNAPQQFAKARAESIERIIKPIEFYKTKAARIKEISKRILDEYRGKTPDNIDELMKLPGVGRKTANCVLVYGFRKPAIPVDVHVHRISNRLGIVKTKIPEETEQKLMQIVPRKDWIDVNELLVKHGQQTCRSIKPLCLANPKECPLIEVCNYYARNN